MEYKNFHVSLRLIPIQGTFWVTKLDSSSTGASSPFEGTLVHSTFRGLGEKDFSIFLRRPAPNCLWDKPVFSHASARRMVNALIAIPPDIAWVSVPAKLLGVNLRHADLVLSSGLIARCDFVRSQSMPRFGPQGPTMAPHPDQAPPCESGEYRSADPVRLGLDHVTQ